MVPSTFCRLKAAGRCLSVVLATLLFVGCGTRTPDQSIAHMQGAAQADSGFYLQQMQQSSDNSKTNWQLLAIHALLKEGQSRQALGLFEQLPQGMNVTQRREQLLLAIELQVAFKNFTGARSLLAKLSPAELSPNQQARYWQAQIDCAQGRPSLDLLRALIARQPLLAAQDKQKNIDATWQLLSTMSQQQARALTIGADENVLQGWLDLQRMWFDNRNDPGMLKAAIADWQKRYPHNPGASLLPTPLLNVQGYKPTSARKIALLLPLNGRAAIFGRTIQQGFEAAKNMGTLPVVQPRVSAPEASADAQPETGDTVASPSQTPVNDLTNETPPAAPAPAPLPAAIGTPASPSAELKIYDTSSQPLSQILAQVQQDGASIVVGPLLKNNVDELVRSNTPLNVLALNQPEAVQNHINICYFALSPEDEARDAARHIYGQGKQAPLLLLPRSTLGSRVASAFASEWQALGGGVVLQQTFGSTAELRMGVNGGGGITLSGTPVASAAMTQGSGGRVDAVYILATPEEIAFIKPMIAMRNGSQSRATLYASSRSAQGNAGPDFRLEMEGLQFSEIPMLAGGNDPLMQQALSAVRNDYSLARMYAMGVDAWSLANHFSQLRQVPGFEIGGNTGTLTASQECVINRKLSWLKYQQGQIVPAS
ncbi:penicillin-binding protein activator [Intestinirhabdus alba]|jgi:outer membrane PBP1 activator LpoA protein|uniref:Penicillin-binding protein activator LpoA n=1 Tax=Intestinirhabdus alba TaxID=2899544 RepID=A0A6L6ILZ2_9ENTR|nr:penicillin-binding protein activator [Intestinirhabdus alba]MTH45753.1 penicillin-binding protein activator [Intestinirhabdus alba]